VSAHYAPWDVAMGWGLAVMVWTCAALFIGFTVLGLFALYKEITQ
jgi:hypothetical protein